MQCDTEKKGNHDECMIKTELFLHFRSQSVTFIAGSQQKIYKECKNDCNEMWLLVLLVYQ